MQDYLGAEFKMMGVQNMSAIHIMVFAHRTIWQYCWETRTSIVPTGFGNMVGNKGGTQIGMRIGRTKILFVNVHLAAHAEKMRERTADFARILLDSPMKENKEAQHGIHNEYDRVFFMGDLNIRLNASRADVDAWLHEEDGIGKCLQHDQLLPLLETKSDSPRQGMWSLFAEEPIKFLPTYKYDKHSDLYDTSKKQRVPSWTDRILWKRCTRIRPLSYDAVRSLTCSDHRPVFAQFEVSIDLDEWKKDLNLPVRDEGRSNVCSVQ